MRRALNNEPAMVISTYLGLACLLIPAIVPDVRKTLGMETWMYHREDSPFVETRKDRIQYEQKPVTVDDILAREGTYRSPQD
jgi:adenine/guanine phosphoribosyltransferase-like PRPP-binding protein